MRPILLAYLPPLALLLLSQLQSKVTAGELLRDPLAQTGSPPYLGALSNLGILMWCGAACVCLFSWYVLARHRARPRDRSFLLATAGLTSLLMFDDLFQIHEHVAPRILAVSQKAVLTIYGGIALLYLLRYLPMIFRRDRPLLYSIGACFATSLLVDLDLIELSQDSVNLIEDGAKFLGTSGWLVYCARRASDVILPQPHASA